MPIRLHFTRLYQVPDSRALGALESPSRLLNLAALGTQLYSLERERFTANARDCFDVSACTSAIQIYRRPANRWSSDTLPAPYMNK